MGNGATNLILLVVGCFMLCHTLCSSSTQSFLRQGQSLQYPDQILSKSRKFLLCFFDRGYYSENLSVSLGLFYNLKSYIPLDANFSSFNPVWVADHNANYLVDGSANLTLGHDGSLKILYEGGRAFVLYSSPAPTNSIVFLQDNGNLVLREVNSNGSFRQDLWQSFDHPTDTLVPEMKLGLNYKTGKILTLVAGSFTLGVDPTKINQLAIWMGGDLYWTSGAWKNGNFTSFTGLSRSQAFHFDYVSNENGTYFTLHAIGYMLNPRLALYGDGSLSLTTADSTDSLVDCYDDYDRHDEGCVQKLPWCRGSRYYSFGYWGIMSGSGTMMSKNLSEYECGSKCFFNCSCLYYTYVNDTECVVWSHESTFREASDSDGGIPITGFPFRGDPIGRKKFSWWIWLAIAVSGAAAVAVISWCCYMVATRCCFVVATRCKSEVEARWRQKMLLREIGGDRLRSSTKQKKENKTQQELHIFGLKTIVSATNNFSCENQLGKGGYGAVYKGRLPDGQKIAIKRLATSSGQGLVEFKKEAILIAKLQHTNLVRLLGFCVQGDEKALVYEYMPNKSLDFYLFDSDRKKTLDWKKRFIIIEGIAQGLVYLHKYSRLKVIHRDLKASNVLLDREMNPKISDFGMARLLAPGDSEENTNRIVGTFGYMPPEYVLQGTVSIKTDVFSFGILLLEIITGRKNNSRRHPDDPQNLSGYAWSLWKQGDAVELIDPSLDESSPRDEVMKCIQVGLLCAQDQASHRPTMIDVVFMLSTESPQLPQPRKPAFFISNAAETPEEETHAQVEIFSINELTMSNIEVR